MAKISDAKKKVPKVPQTGMFYLHDDRLQPNTANKSKKSPAKMSYRKKSNQNDDQMWCRDKFSELESGEPPLLQDSPPSFYRKQKKKLSRKKRAGGRYRSRTDGCDINNKDKNDSTDMNMNDNNINNNNNNNITTDNNDKDTNDKKEMNHHDKEIEKNSKNKGNKKETKSFNREKQKNSINGEENVKNNKYRTKKEYIEKKDQTQERNKSKELNSDRKKMFVNNVENVDNQNQNKINQLKKVNRKEKEVGKFKNNKKRTSNSHSHNKSKRGELKYQKKKVDKEIVSMNEERLESKREISESKITAIDDVNEKKVKDQIYNNKKNQRNKMVNDKEINETHSQVHDINGGKDSYRYRKKSKRTLENDNKSLKRTLMYVPTTKLKENNAVVAAPSTIIPKVGEPIISSFDTSTMNNTRVKQITNGRRVGRGRGRGRGFIGRIVNEGNNSTSIVISNMISSNNKKENPNKHVNNNNNNNANNDTRNNNVSNNYDNINNNNDDDDNNNDNNDNKMNTGTIGEHKNDKDGAYNNQAWARMNPNAKEFVSEMNSNTTTATPQLMVFDHFGNALPFNYMQNTLESVESSYMYSDTSYPTPFMGPTMMYPGSAPLDANVYGFQATPSPPPTTNMLPQQQLPQQQLQQLEKSETEPQQSQQPKVLQKPPTNIQTNSELPLRFSDI